MDVLWVKRKLSEVRFLKLQVGTVGAATAACCYRLTESDRKEKGNPKDFARMSQKKAAGCLRFPLSTVPTHGTSKRSDGGELHACMHI